jgi:hypothetical protein
MPALTTVYKYKKDQKLFVQFSIKQPEDILNLKISSELTAKYQGSNDSLSFTREGNIINYNIEFTDDDQASSATFINTIYSIIDSHR